MRKIIDIQTQIDGLTQKKAEISKQIDALTVQRSKELLAGGSDSKTRDRIIKLDGDLSDVGLMLPQLAKELAEAVEADRQAQIAEAERKLSVLGAERNAQAGVCQKVRDDFTVAIEAAERKYSEIGSQIWQQQSIVKNLTPKPEPKPVIPDDAPIFKRPETGPQFTTGGRQAVFHEE